MLELYPLIGSLKQGNLIQVVPKILNHIQERNIMIFDYGFSVVGKSHILKGTICQDSHGIKRMDNGWYIAVVADGVGSAANSHIGSRIAVNSVIEFCDKYMPWDYSIISIKSMLRTAYNHAFNEIIKESKESGEPIESYDTTLTMVIYDGRRIIYGHSGDGGIIGLNTFGDYIEITKAQKGSDYVSVIPLRAGYTQWEIDSYNEDLSAVILVTDGMLETLCPSLLRDVDNDINNIYIPLGIFFGDPTTIPEDTEGRDNLKEIIGEFVKSSDGYDGRSFYDRLLDIYRTHIPVEAEDVVNSIKKLDIPIKLMEEQQDDKTIVGLINPEMLVDKKNVEFYSEPDWKSLDLARKRLLYPHLYDEEDKKDLATTTDEAITDESDVVDESAIQSSSDIGIEGSLKVTTKKLVELRTNRYPILSHRRGRSSSYQSEKPAQVEAGIKGDRKPEKKGLLSRIGDIFGND